jgi:hypothetical protein
MQLDQEKKWLLRLSALQIDWLGYLGPDVEVCVRRHGDTDEPFCMPYAGHEASEDVRQALGMTRRFNVTTADLMLGQGIDIFVRRGDELLAEHLGASHKEIGIAALCIGLLFPVYPPGQKTAAGYHRVAFYLDDP